MESQQHVSRRMSQFSSIYSTMDQTSQVQQGIPYWDSIKILNKLQSRKGVSLRDLEIIKAKFENQLRKQYGYEQMPEPKPRKLIINKKKPKKHRSKSDKQQMLAQKAATSHFPALYTSRFYDSNNRQLSLQSSPKKKSAEAQTSFQSLNNSTNNSRSLPALPIIPVPQMDNRSGGQDSIVFRQNKVSGTLLNRNKVNFVRPSQFDFSGVGEFKQNFEVVGFDDIVNANNKKYQAMKFHL